MFGKRSHSAGGVLRLRPPVPADADGVFAVIRARDLADLGVVDYARRDLDDEWAASEFDLAADARVVEDPASGEVVAYAVLRRAGGIISIHPEHEHPGLAGALLAFCEGRARERGYRLHRQMIGASHEPMAAMLAAAGYRHVRSYFRMVLPLTPGAGIEPPPGVTLRAVDPDDDAVTLHALDAESFAENPDYTPESLTAFREEELGGHDFAPELSVLAEHEGVPAGFALVRRWEADAAGFIAVLAVGPGHRRQGIGRTLLDSAFARCAAAGLREGRLGVASDNPRAMRLYEQAGMRPSFRFDTYERRSG